MLIPDAKVDVLIPAFNVGATVVEAVASILNQTFRDIRVVVVDDGSGDDTAEKLAALAAMDSRLSIHRQANGGIVDALNNGLELCTAEYVARHDADDIAFPDRLEKQLAYLEANPDCVAVGANAFHIDETGRRTGSRTLMRNPAWSDANRIPAEEPYLMHPVLLVRRKALSDIGGYRYVFHSEDTDLYWRLRSIGRLHNLEDFLAEYRIHANSISGKSVVNGRVQAIASQLAALSERRRAKGDVDLEFPRALLQRYHAARSIRAMIAVAEEGLRPAEFAHFRLAVAAKLVELESYRPYELDSEDRAFIKDIYRQHASLLSKGDKSLSKKRRAKYMAKLVTRGKFRAASEVFTPTIARPFVFLLINFLMRRIVPSWKW